MGKTGKQGYLERIYGRYRKAAKEEKRKILDEFWRSVVITEACDLAIKEATSQGG
jgi:hypothetical protein